MTKNPTINRRKFLIYSAFASLSIAGCSCRDDINDDNIDNANYSLEEKADNKADTKQGRTGRVLASFPKLVGERWNHLTDEEKHRFNRRWNRLDKIDRVLLYKIYLSPREFYDSLGGEKREGFENFRVRRLGSIRARRIIRGFPWMGRNFEDLDYLMYTPNGEEAENERLSDFALSNKLTLYFFQDKFDKNDEKD